MTENKEKLTTSHSSLSTEAAERCFFRAFRDAYGVEVQSTNPDNPFKPVPDGFEIAHNRKILPAGSSHE